MFDNATNITFNDYEVNLDNIIKAVCEISLDIGIQLQEIIDLRNKDQGFTILDLFSDDVLTEMSIRSEELLDRTTEDGERIPGIGKEGLISKISAYFNKKITRVSEFENALKNPADVLLLDRKHTHFLGIKDGGKERLKTAIKKAKILKMLVSRLANERIQKSLEKIEIFENDIFYKNVINAEKLEGQPDALLVPFRMFQEDLLTIEPIDEDNIWINTTYYKKQDSDFKIDAGISVVLDVDKNKIGILTDNHLIPYVGIDISNYIKPDIKFEYYFSLIEKSYTVKRRDSTDRNDPLVKSFIEARKNPKLNQLLSNLKNNFYLDGAVEIDADFASFFNSVMSFEELDHLKEYNFLLSKSVEHETALGVYSNEKKDTDYNLIHWLNHDGEHNLRHYRKLEPSAKKKKFVSALKPAICYYFLAKYFEDLVESIFKENGNKFFSNHSLYIDKVEFSEIDFFIQSPTKLVYVEAKTKLTKYYIESFLKKSSKLLERFKPMTEQGVSIEFLLLGCFSDNSVTDYQYFIDESQAEESGYNKKRDNLNCIPYNFKVPIPDKEGKTITCVAEPEFDKLQKLLLEICPK